MTCHKSTRSPTYPPSGWQAGPSRRRSSTGAGGGRRQTAVFRVLCFLLRGVEGSGVPPGRDSPHCRRPRRSRTTPCGRASWSRRGWRRRRTSWTAATRSLTTEGKRRQRQRGRLRGNTYACAAATAWRGGGGVVQRCEQALCICDSHQVDTYLPTARRRETHPHLPTHGRRQGPTPTYPARRGVGFHPCSESIARVSSAPWRVQHARRRCM